jgi:hypothetical protein
MVADFLCQSLKSASLSRDGKRTQNPPERKRKLQSEDENNTPDGRANYESESPVKTSESSIASIEAEAPSSGLVTRTFEFTIGADSRPQPNQSRTVTEESLEDVQVGDDEIVDESTREMREIIHQRFMSEEISLEQQKRLWAQTVPDDVRRTKKGKNKR